MGQVRDFQSEQFQGAADAVGQNVVHALRPVVKGGNGRENDAAHFRYPPHIVQMG